MSIAITVTPTEPVGAASAARIDITGASPNTLVGYNDENFPASPEVRCYLTFSKDGAEMGRSYVFAVSEDGKHTFPNYTFPSAGSWTVALIDAADDSTLASQAVTVS